MDDINIQLEKLKFIFQTKVLDSNRFSKKPYIKLSQEYFFANLIFAEFCNSFKTYKEDSDLPYLSTEKLLKNKNALDLLVDNDSATIKQISETITDIFYQSLREFNKIKNKNDYDKKDYIAKIQSIFYENDPGHTTCKENSLTDEYATEAAYYIELEGNNVKDKLNKTFEKFFNANGQIYATISVDLLNELYQLELQKNK